MPESVTIEPFEQQIIDSIENLLLDDEKIQEPPKAMMPLTGGQQINHRGPTKVRPQLHLDLNQQPTKVNGYQTRPYQIARSPIIEAVNYSGSEDYIRWSTVESDEWNASRQMAWQDPTTYEQMAYGSGTPIDGNVAAAAAVANGAHPYQVSSPQSSLPSPVQTPPLLSPSEAQLILNQYLLYNQKLYEDLKLRNLTQLLNGINPMLGLPMQYANYNQVLANFNYNQWAQQRLLNQQQDYNRLCNYYKSVKYQKSFTSPPKVFCSFCKNNGEPK